MNWRAVAFVLLTGLLTFLLLTELLLLGVEPRLVFAPGFAVKSLLHAPNAVGVLCTGLLYWAAIIVIWLIVAKAVRR